MCLNYACAYAIVRNTNADCRKQTVAVAKKVHTYSYTFTIYVHFVYLSQLVLQRFVQHEILLFTIISMPIMYSNKPINNDIPTQHFSLLA